MWFVKSWMYRRASCVEGLGMRVDGLGGYDSLEYGMPQAAGNTYTIHINQLVYAHVSLTTDWGMVRQARTFLCDQPSTERIARRLGAICAPAMFSTSVKPCSSR